MFSRPPVTVFPPSAAVGTVVVRGRPQVLIADKEKAHAQSLAAALRSQNIEVTVVDPRTRVMSVYHVDAKSGEIVLKSVRNIHWDLQMIEFNAVSPLPREIRSQLNRQ